MRSGCAQSPSDYKALVFVIILAFVGQPLWAQGESDDHRVFPERPPAGYARPPIHLKGTNATRGPSGMSPSATRHAYGFDQITNQGAGQVIGIVDAYDDPNIESDLGMFDSQFGLPLCTSSNGCFSKVYAQGSRPSANAGWALEISLDVEWAHAIAPQARIVLVEAASNSFTNLMQTVDVAVQKASVVSMSFGGGEFFGETSYDTHFAVNGVTFTASSGDSGNGVEYPAASPDVVAVGGTTLTTGSGGSYGSETAWSGSGGGQSTMENEPSYQVNYLIPNDPSHWRGVPDVAYDANPNTGFAVYDTVRYQGQSGWFQVGGTSAGAPQWAALFAIANSTRAALGKSNLSSTSTAVYKVASANITSNFHDITSGTNGSCGTLCTAVTGYDYVTGLGSPQANNIIPALMGY